MLKPLKVKHPARAEHTAPVSWTLTSLAHPLLPLLNQLHIPTILIISPLPCPSRWTLWCHHGHSLKTPSSRICHQEPPRCLLQLLPSSLHPPLPLSITAGGNSRPSRPALHLPGHLASSCSLCVLEESPETSYGLQSQVSACQLFLKSHQCPLCAHAVLFLSFPQMTPLHGCSPPDWETQPSSCCAQAVPCLK